MKVGMVFSCWMNDLEKQLELYKDSGFDGIEVRLVDEREYVSVGRHVPPGTLRIGHMEDDAHKLAKAARSVGIEVHSIMCSPLWKYSLTSPNEKYREIGLSIIRNAINAAKILGAGALLIIPGVVTEEVGYEEAMKLARDNLSKVVSLAEKNEVLLAVENVGNRFLLSPLEMRSFIDGFNSDYVKAYLDVGNIVLLRQGYPWDWIRILGSRIVRVHVKDYSSRTNSVTYLLQGDIDWRAVIKALKEVGYNDYLTAELPPYRILPEKMLKDTASSLRMIINLS